MDPEGTKSKTAKYAAATSNLPHWTDAIHGYNTNDDENEGDPIKTTTDAGHGDKTGCCTDPGTLDGKNQEKDYALKVEQEVNKWLNEWGVVNQSTRTGDIDKSGQKKIAWRIKMAKDHGSIIMVSIHLDSGGKDGLFAIYDKDNAESKKLANSIAGNYSFGLGDSDGVKEDVRNLGIVQRFPGKASVLLELGGIANQKLINRINTNSNLMGYDIAKGMYMYLTGDAPPLPKTNINSNQFVLPWEKWFKPLKF